MAEYKFTCGCDFGYGQDVSIMIITDYKSGKILGWFEYEFINALINCGFTIDEIIDEIINPKPL